MQIIEVQRGSIEARNASSIKLQRGELFINNINASPEILVGLGNGSYERMGGMGTLSFAGVKSPEDLKSLLNGASKPTQGGVYVLKGGDLNISEITGNFYEPNSQITLFSGYSLTDKIYDGDILAYVKNGATADQNDYGWIKLISEKSLKVVLDTKADLDPATGKVLLSQLPDTVTGGMDYQGTWNKKSLPTKNAGRDNDTAIDPSLETHENLHKGDYWAYSGADWDISSLTNIEYKGTKENNEKFFVKSGDLIVYNGNGKWGIIDNTDAFIGIKAKSLWNDETAVIDGIVILLDAAREEGLTETRVDLVGNGFKVSAPNAALIPNDETANPGTLYKEKNGNKVLTPSGISEDTISATIDESNAQLNLKSSKFGRTTEIRTNTDGNATTIQVLPKTSGIILNSNSIIDCGEWTTDADGTIRFSCEEGNTSSDYIPTDTAYQTQGTLKDKFSYLKYMVDTSVGLSAGKYEVTREAFKAVLGYDPSASYSCTESEGDQRPVDNVTLAQAKEFCNAISALDGFTPYYDGNGNPVDGANGYRLPTKNEFISLASANGKTATYSGTNGSLSSGGNDASYDVFIGDPIGYETSTAGKQIPVYDSSVATRAVSQSDLQSWVNPFTSSIANIGDPELAKYAWTKYNIGTGDVEKVPQPLSSVAAGAWDVYKYNGVYYKSNAYGWASRRGNVDDGIYGTHAVGTRLPNEFGLYDMTGNVSELLDDGSAFGGDVAANTSKIALNLTNTESKVVGFRVVRNI